MATTPVNPAAEKVSKGRCVHGVPWDDHCEACCPDCQDDIAEMLSGYCECGAVHSRGTEETDCGVAALEVLGVPFELVGPNVWKKEMRLQSDPKMSLARARTLFPTADLRLEKHHNRADALLLAEWGRLRAVKEGRV